MRRAVIAESDKKIAEELERILCSHGLETEKAGQDDLAACLKRLSGPDLRLVMIEAAFPRFREDMERAKLAAPSGIFIALVDIDQRSVLDAAIREGLVDDFLPLPFSAADVRGILKLLEERP